MIGQRVRQVRERFNMSQPAFAKAIGITQPSLSAIENGGGTKSQTLSEICKVFNISMDFLTLGIDKAIDQTMPTVTSDASAAYNTRRGNVTFVPLVAYGGFMEGYQNHVYQDNLETFSIPGIIGEHYAFEVSGNSMEPVIYHQELVIAKPEEKLEYMVPGRMYVIVSVRGIHVKRFEKIGKDGDYYFRSVNKSSPKFPPLPPKEIKKIYQVIRVMEDPHKRGYFEEHEN